MKSECPFPMLDVILPRCARETTREQPGKTAIAPHENGVLASARSASLERAAQTANLLLPRSIA